MSPRPCSGFTLAELAVVLTVLALLLGGLLVPLSGQQEMKNRQDTERALAAAQEALIGFALINGRLPCPATAAGDEATSGSGAALACSGTVTDGHIDGVLPWVTLGLPETDPWGNRYSYGVTAHYARGIDPAQTNFGADCTLNPPDRHSYDPALGDGPRQSAFAICTPGALTVLASDGTTKLASGVPAVVASRGKSDDSADDLVTWIPTGLLVGRMMAAGRLP